MGKGILLFLKRQQVVDPLNHEQALEETEGQGALVKGIPVNGVEHVDAGPRLMPEKV